MKSLGLLWNPLLLTPVPAPSPQVPEEGAHTERSGSAQRHPPHPAAGAGAGTQA